MGVAMKLISFFIPSLFSLPLLAANGLPEKVILFKKGCERETACRTHFQGREKDFTLTWKSYREGVDDFLEIKIENETFHISTAPDLIKSHPFPMKLYIFSNSLKLYGSLSNAGSAGLFVNYFYRDSNHRFHYLGLFPFLVYDKSSGYFISGENIDPKLHLISYYKLENNSLILKKTENALEQTRE